MIKELVEHVVKQLVSKPDVVAVTVISRGNANVLEISVDQKDRGRLIGKEGQTIKALRSLVSVIVPEKKKIVIDII